MKTWKNILFYLLLLFSANLSAQKEYKQIKQYLKQGGTNLDKVITEIDTLAKNDEFRGEAELYQFAVEAQRGINEVENEKIYLKQKYDTARFFSSILQAFKYSIKVDSIESIPSKSGRVRYKFRSKNRDLLKSYYPNVLNAGLFYLKKREYQKADGFFSMLLSADSLKFLKDGVQTKLALTKPYIAYWSMLCRYNSEKYNKVFEYSSISKSDEKLYVQSLELMSKSYGKLKEDSAYVKTLLEGIKADYKNPFFYTRLIDYYNANSCYDASLALTDSMLKRDSTDVLYLYAKSVVLISLKRYDESILYSRMLIDRDSLNSDSYYNVGLCYCNKAADVEANLSPNVYSKKYRTEKANIRDYYKNAQPFVEEYRAKMPNAVDKWAPLLYRIYLALNMGKQFDEIEKIQSSKQ